jgi:hypothetical protein
MLPGVEQPLPAKAQAVTIADAGHLRTDPGIGSTWPLLAYRTDRDGGANARGVTACGER